MEHVYSSQESIETPWRTAAIIAAAVAALELFVLIIVGVVFGAKLVTDRAESAVRAPRATTAKSESARSTKSGASTEQGRQKTTPVAGLPRSQTSVIVLNGNGLSGAASVGAERVRGFHYLIAATGNAPRTDFQRSIVMYRPGFKGEAIRLAHELHVGRVTPLDGLTRRDLQGAHLAYVIGG